MAKELTWRKAIEKVLSEAPGAMHYKDITEKIIQDGLRSSLGATPERTVVSAAITAIKNEGDECPFQKIGRGLLVWKAKAGITQKPSVPVEEVEEDQEVQYEIISSFGMFWRRDAIEWMSTPKLLGMQQIGAKAVDFHKQVGIYLLYDGREVIYVGRATDRPLGRRLFEHTADRLSTRWDRFSWFGLLPVSEAGELGSVPESYLGMKIVPAVEAILIEALEPRQNRKRGDDLSAVEYIQKEDPEIQRKKVKQSVEVALSKL
ncbi:MAG TPA: HTH domain-containing protein [Gemmatales bacterium]|nr:HTH domain-containing protein [Gemmatales bacterium]